MADDNQNKIQINSVYSQLYDIDTITTNPKLRSDVRYGICYGGRRSGKSTHISADRDEWRGSGSRRTAGAIPCGTSRTSPAP